MIGPPTFFVGLMGAPGFRAERVASLRLVSSGGAGVTPAFVEDAAATAARSGQALLRIDRGPDGHHARPRPTRRAGRDTDGRVVGRARLRIAADGELLVQGPELFVGYLDAEPDPRRGRAAAGSAPATSPPSPTAGSPSSAGRRT